MQELMLDPDAVLVLARQFIKLRHLYVGGGRWLDASALDVLLSEAVQGYQLRISACTEPPTFHVPAEERSYSEVGLAWICRQMSPKLSAQLCYWLSFAC
jgi:hypothetical protein